MHVGPIERGIPLPRSRREGNKELRYRMHTMNIGDSFLTTCNTGSISAMARKLNIKCETRKAGDGKLRVWRVA